MTFKSLPIGAKFEFESIKTFPFSGFERGPWIKTSARGYRKADDNGLKYRVGSVSAKVERLNPGKRNPIEYRFVGGYYVSTRKRPGKGRVVSLPRGYVKDPDGVYRKARKRNPSKRKTRKRVAAALTKYVRGKQLRNFTGVVRQNPDGSVVIIGTGPKPPGARSLNPRAFYELKRSDVGKKTIKAFGKRWPVAGFIGHIGAYDVGKRVYDQGGFLQVENDSQMAARRRT